MTTQEKNEVIAIWMGGVKGEPESDVSDLWFFGDKHQKYLRYETSWDWLMPVVEKIELLGTRIVIYDNKAHIESHDLANDEQFYGSEGTKIGATYDCVFKFIDNANVK